MKQYQIRYRELFTHAPIGIINSSIEGKLYSVNPTMAKMLGYDSSEDLISLIDSDIKLLYDDLSDRDNIINILKKGKNVIDYEFKLIRKNKSTMWVSLSVNALLDENDELLYLQSYVIDITKRKELEKFKEGVNQITHHNLKGALTPIISYPTLLLDSDNLTEEQKTFIKHIQTAGYKLLRMIYIYLDLYQMEKGTYTFNPVKTDLISVIRDVETDLSALCKAHQNKLIVQDLKNRDEFIVMGDNLLCYIIFSNLIRNAIESTEPYKLINVKLDDDVLIHNPSVIPKEIQDKIGEKYITFGKEKGMGLGIYSVRLIIKIMNGTLEWTSRKEDGTYFKVTLPLPQ